jgi:hypothetical protein
MPSGAWAIELNAIVRRKIKIKLRIRINVLKYFSVVERYLLNHKNSANKCLQGGQF